MRLEDIKEFEKEIEKIDMPNKYQVVIDGARVDIYDVLNAYGVTNQAVGHAVKKLLMAGRRGYKDKVQDLKEAKSSIERAIELEL